MRSTAIMMIHDGFARDFYRSLQQLQEYQGMVFSRHLSDLQ